MDLILGILELVELLFAPFEVIGSRAKQRQETEDLNRRPPKEWENLV